MIVVSMVRRDGAEIVKEAGCLGSFSYRCRT